MDSALSPTAKVVLGMLRLGARTGYDVKRLVDISTRFFWNASYGQIYPELRRLEARGLVEAEDDPRGEVRRRAYRLTPAGEAALHDWLTEPRVGDFAIRDEGLLRFFFSDWLTPDEVLANLRREREAFEDVLRRFRELETVESDRPEDAARFPDLALRYGIELIEWIVRWHRRTERELSRKAR
jgi:DNA-binding PadR family transcriptional regulator